MWSGTINLQNENIRVTIRRHHLIRSTSGTSSNIPLQWSLKHPNDLLIHIEGKDDRPIFDRSDVVVNTEKHLEDTTDNKEDSQRDAPEKSKSCCSYRSSSRNSYGKQSREYNHNRKVSPAREREKCRDKRYERQSSEKESVSPSCKTSAISSIKASLNTKYKERTPEARTCNCNTENQQRPKERRFSEKDDSRKEGYRCRSCERGNICSYLTSKNNAADKEKHDRYPEKESSSTCRRRNNRSPYSRKRNLSPHSQKYGNFIHLDRDSRSSSAIRSSSRSSNLPSLSKRDQKSYSNHSPRVTKTSNVSSSSRTNSSPHRTKSSTYTRCSQYPATRISNDTHQKSRSHSPSKTTDKTSKNQEQGCRSSLLDENQFGELPVHFGCYRAGGLWMNGPGPRFIPPPMTIPPGRIIRPGPPYIIPKPLMFMPHPAHRFAQYNLPFRPRMRPPTSFQ